MTQTYGFGNRPKGSELEIHGDPRIIPSSVHKAADLYSPVFAEVLLSTSIRTKRHRVWVFNAAQMDPSCTYTGRDGPGPAGVCLDRLTAWSGRNFHLSLISHKCVCANGCLDTEAGILRVSHTQRVCETLLLSCWLFSVVFNTHFERPLRPCRVGLRVKFSSVDNGGCPCSTRELRSRRSTN